MENQDEKTKKKEHPAVAIFRAHKRKSICANCRHFMPVVEIDSGIDYQGDCIALPPQFVGIIMGTDCTDPFLAFWPTVDLESTCSHHQPTETGVNWLEVKKRTDDEAKSEEGGK